MRKVYLILVLMQLVYSSQSQTILYNPDEVAGTGDDRSQLSKLNKQFFQNFLNNDTVTHNKIVYKDFTLIAGNGKTVNRNDYMKAWSQGYKPENFKSFIQQNEFIRLFGNTALVICETKCSWMENGKEVFLTTVYTDTYLKIDGRWWCVQAQLTSKKDNG
jgi:Domain of unknown function (DUF4440)